jgi:hypothetical protein
LAIELLTNRAETTLNDGISDSDLTLDVFSAATFPSTGNFRILVENELMLVTSVSGNTFTVERGAEGTNAILVPQFQVF